MIVKFLKQTTRILPRRLIFLIVIILVVVYMMTMLGTSLENDEDWYKHPNVHFKEVECEHDEFTMRLYTQLTELMDVTFKKLGLTYFLCYGSLWGALRMQKTLPWDRNIDFCVMQHELAAVEESTFHQAFKTNGLKYKYNSRRGKYIVTYKTVTAEVTVFERVGSHVERTGWERRLIPHFYVNYQNFPYHLIEKLPLPTENFNGVRVPIPHDTFEIQKYLYPDNWWKVIKPKGCPD